MLSRRAHKAVVYVFLGFLNVVGTVGGLIFYGNIGKEDQQPLGDSEQHLQVAGSYCHTGYTFQVNRIKILKMVTCDLEDFWVSIDDKKLNVHNFVIHLEAINLHKELGISKLNK